MQADLTNLMRTYAIFSLLSLGAITMLAGWQAGRLLAPLRQMSETAREISVTDLSRRLPETGNDDISALTRTVNQMQIGRASWRAGVCQYVEIPVGGGA